MKNILIGPFKRDYESKDIISSYEVLGDYAASPDVLTFNQMVLIDDESISTSFNDILYNLPFSWRPDYIIFWGVDKEIIPDELEESEYPVIGVVLNWDMAFDAVSKNMSRFDWVFTDKKGAQIFKDAGFSNVSSIQLRGFSPNLTRKIGRPFKEKNYDITFIGDLSSELHGERNKLLYRILKLSDKYKINIATEVYGNDYVNLINSSKIVFNHCNKQEANSRCFEVPACGSLLFVEEENLEIRDYFNDKEHCIFYNNDNLEELLKYYLENPEESEKIANQGYEKVQEYSYENMFSYLVSEIEKLDFNELRKNRTFREMHRLEKHKAIAKQALQSVVPGKFYIVERELQGALDIYSSEPELLNNLAVIYANAYFTLMNKEDKKLLHSSIKFLNDAIGFSPSYAVARFNLGCIYYLDGEYKKAEDILNSCIMCISTAPEESIELKGFYYIPPNISLHDDFKMEWEKATYTYFNNENDLSYGYCDLLMQRAFEILGDISAKNFDLELAEEMYKNSIQVKDNIGYIKFKLGKVLEMAGNYQEAYDYYNEMIKDKPLYLETWVNLVKILDKVGKMDDYEATNLLALEISKLSPLYDQFKKELSRNLTKIL